MAEKKAPLPHPALVLEARSWLFSGCPVIDDRQGFFQVQRARRTLIELLEALPSHHKMYSFGTPENRAAMDEPLPEEEEAQKKRDVAAQRAGKK